MKHLLHRLLTTLLVLLSLQIALHAYGNYYVKSTATGAGDGSSWTNAFTDLQVAIDQAEKGDVICVAAGTYLPNHRHQGDALRHSTFYINKDVIIYGGFSGAPGTEGTLQGRDPKVHVTTLSGNLGVITDSTYYAFHVVFIDHVSDTMRLDGFVIEHGNGFGGAGYEAAGAGIFNNADAGRSNPVIANCIIRDNNAREAGGGLYIQAQNGGQGNPMLVNCSFIRNRGSGGGAIFSYTDNAGDASPTLIGCSFLGNTGATADGGAISIVAHSSTTSPRFINCIFTGNYSTSTSAAFGTFVTGTGISTPEFINCAFSGNVAGSIRMSDIGAHNSVAKIRNCILWGNGSGVNHGLIVNGAAVDVAFSIAAFGVPGEGNIDLDPMFVSMPPIDSAHTLGDLHLLPGSPAFDAGRNSDVPAGTITDLDGSPRFINAVNGQAGTVDIGPYEFQSSTTGVSDFLLDTEWKVYPNPASDELTISLSETAENVEVHLLSLQGSIIQTQSLQSGQRDYTLNVTQLPTGSYLVHLMIDGLQDIKKVIIE